MNVLEYGNPNASTVLIQPVDDHDLQEIENEVRLIRELSGADFRLIAWKVDRWNHDLSPWEAEAVFGDEGFGNGAAETLAGILELTRDSNKTYFIGGYSLAGLFALWAAFQTDVFRGVAAASPSVWFPGFVDFVKTNHIHCTAAYLSLGTKEAKTRNPVMATVGDRIRELDGILQDRGVRSTLEWNPGNHFREPDVRTAKAFAWVLGNQQ